MRAPRRGREDAMSDEILYEVSDPVATMATCGGPDGSWTTAPPRATAVPSVQTGTACRDSTSAVGPSCSTAARRRSMC